MRKIICLLSEKIPEERQTFIFKLFNSDNCIPKLKPNGAQIRQMHQFAGNARKVRNLALAQQEANYALGEKFTNIFGMNKSSILNLRKKVKPI